MSEQVIVAGVTYLSSGTVAGKFGYSLDYISRLAREGRVDATRIGKKWFIDPSSVERFIEVSKLKKAKTSAELSAARKLELTIAAKQGAAERGGLEQTERSYRKNIAIAIAGSSMIMVAGLLVGVLYNPHVPIIQGQISSTIQVGTPEVPVSGSVAIDKKPLNKAVNDARFASATPAMGMVIFTESASSMATKTVKQSFSDEVKVEFLSTVAGQVRPVFRSGTSSEAYNFIVVPLE